MILFWNRHKYIRVISFNKDKTSSITYHKRKDFKPKFLLNPDHVFNANGFQTVVISETSAETINPLDFTSKYDAKSFKSAINNKLISDTFETMKSNKLDLDRILLFASLLVNFIILFILIKEMGII